MVAFTFRYMRTVQQVIVQASRLVDGTESRGRQMKGNHIVQNFREDFLLKDIGLELSFGGLHTKGKVVAASNILSIVETAPRSIASMTNLNIAECC